MIAIDMKMPESCLECFACEYCNMERYSQPYCRLIAYRDKTAEGSMIDLSGDQGRVDKCPLMPVKTDEECQRPDGRSD